MGHALGLVGLVQGSLPKWFDFRTGRYTGELALEGYRREFRSKLDTLAVDQGFHWSFGGDVMSSVYPGGSDRISFVTIGALMDLGYPAAWYGARSY
jgi:hypothetical protein